MSDPKWRIEVALIAGLLLSGVLLWLALRDVDSAALATALATVDFVPLLFCAAALAFGITLRAMRWRVVAGFGAPEQCNFARATNLGVLANLLIPGRAGELVRVVTLAKLSRASLPCPLASAFVDRLIDVVVLVCSAVVLCVLFPVGSVLGRWLLPFCLMGGLAALLLVLYARGAGLGEAMAAKVARRWLRRWPLQPEIFFAELRAEFRRLLGNRPGLELLFAAALILCADYLAMSALLLAFGLSLPPEAPLLLWVFLAAGSALPSAPGYVGAYQVAAVWALSRFSVSGSTAVALALVLQITMLAVALLMAGRGSVGVFRRLLVENEHG